MGDGFDVDAHIRKIRNNPFRVSFDRKERVHVAAPAIPGGRFPDAPPKPDKTASSPASLTARALMTALDKDVNPEAEFQTLGQGVPFGLTRASFRGQTRGYVIHRTGSSEFVPQGFVLGLAEQILEGKDPAELVSDAYDRYVLAALASVWDRLSRS